MYTNSQVSHLARWLALFPAGWAAINLGGWIFRCPQLIGPGIEEVWPKANSCLAILLISASLLIPSHEAGISRKVLNTAAYLVQFFMLLTIFEYASGSKLGIDELICKDFLAGTDTVFPGRVPFSSCVLVSLLCFCLTSKNVLIAQLLLAISSWFCIYSIASYTYGLPILQLMRSGQIAFFSALALLLLNCSLLVQKSEFGPAKILRSKNVGGRISRTFFLFTLSFPFLGLLTGVGRQADEDLLILVILICALLPIMTIWIAHEAEKQDRALRQQVELLNKFKNTVAEVVWVINTESKQLLFVSKSFYEVFALKKTDVDRIASLENWIEQVLESDRAKVSEAFQASVQDRDFDFRIQRPDGEERWLSASVRTLAEDQNKSNEIYVIARDVTQEKLKQKHLSEFYATVSHELRTPFSSIRAGLGILELNNKELPEKMSKVLQVSKQECDRMVALINDLLDLSKIEAGLIGLKMEKTSVARITDSAVSAVSYLADQSGIQIEIENNSEADEIYCDKDRIIQVLVNLLSNAIKASDQNQSVKLTLSNSEDNHIFEVEDHGQGIAEEARPRVFSRFFQSAASAQQNSSKPGTGLGLSISKSIVEEHGGKIGFTSTLGKGSKFCFNLPQRKQET